jgi:hypothetical protein
VPVVGLAANFSPMPRMAPPPRGCVIAGGANGDGEVAGLSPPGGDALGEDVGGLCGAEFRNTSPPLVVPDGGAAYSITDGSANVFGKGSRHNETTGHPIG